MIDHIEPEQAGDPLADDRIQFYLRHRAAIREWAAIERDLFEATHRIMVGLIPEIEAAVRDRDDSVIVGGVALDGSWPRIVARRATWPVSPSGDPIVGVTLEWTPKVDPSGGALPYIGVRVEADHPAGKALAETLRPMVAGSDAAAAGFKASNYVWWPVQQRVHASPDWWQAVDGYRTACIDRFGTAWSVLSPLVDQSLDSAGE